jgi:membrane fusion protein, multidrug efflux system
VTATLHLGDLRNAVLVPQSAVGSTQIGRTLMIVGKGNQVEQRLVKLGDNEGDMIVVTDGLKPGERVITGQLQKIRPGTVVQPETDPQ